MNDCCNGCTKRHFCCWSDCKDFAEKKEEDKAKREYLSRGFDARQFLTENAYKTKKRLKIKK